MFGGLLPMSETERKRREEEWRDRVIICSEGKEIDYRREIDFKDLKEIGSRKEIKEPDVDKAKNFTLESIIEENKEIRKAGKTANERNEIRLESEGASQEIDEDDTSSETDESKEGKELTQEEINELQKKAIKDAFERIARGEELTDAEKGNLGEILMDQYYISKGYTPIHKPRVTDLAHKSGQGIDGVYEKTNPDGTKSYVIADAKVNHSQLKKGLADGTDQMSDAWIDKRLDDAVGKEKADAIRDSYEDDSASVSHELYHFSYGETDDGISHADVSTVDESGNKNKDKEVVQTFDPYGNEITGGEHNDQR